MGWESLGGALPKEPYRSSSLLNLRPAFGADPAEVACQVVAAFYAKPLPSPTPAPTRAAEEGHGWVGGEEDEREPQRYVNN